MGGCEQKADCIWLERAWEAREWKPYVQASLTFAICHLLGGLRVFTDHLHLTPTASLAASSQQAMFLPSEKPKQNPKNCSGS